MRCRDTDAGRIAGRRDGEIFTGKGRAWQEMVAGRGWLRPGAGQASQELDTAPLVAVPGVVHECGGKSGAIPVRQLNCGSSFSAGGGGGEPTEAKDIACGQVRGETEIARPSQLVVQDYRAAGGGAAGIGGELGGGNGRGSGVQGHAGLDRHGDEEGGNGIVASTSAARGVASEPGGLSPRADEAGVGLERGTRSKRARGGRRTRLESEDSCDDQQSTPPRWSPEDGPGQRKRLKWTEEEESLLCATVIKFGSSNWLAIQKVI